VIAGGQFLTSGGVVVNHIARWDDASATWVPFGGIGRPGAIGLDGPVLALAVYNGMLIVGGAFTHAGALTANGIAQWNGEGWSALGAGVQSAAGGAGVVHSLAVAAPPCT